MSCFGFWNFRVCGDEIASRNPVENFPEMKILCSHDVITFLPFHIEACGDDIMGPSCHFI